MRKTALGLAPLALAAFTGGIAGAQSSWDPRYVSSEPASGQFVHEGPDEVSITFSQALGARSMMAVTDECGGTVDTGVVSIDDNRMSVSLAKRPRGTYTVTYGAAGAEEDSQTTPGSFTFRVHLGPDCDDSGGGGDHGGHGNDGDGPKEGHQGRQDDDTGTRHDGHAGGRRAHISAHSMDSHASTHSVSDHGEAGHLVAQTDRHGHAPEKRGRHKHRGRDTEPRGGENHSDGEGAPDHGASDTAPDATGVDLAIALGLAAGLGAGGGIVLRFSRFG